MRIWLLAAILVTSSTSMARQFYISDSIYLALGTGQWSSEGQAASTKVLVDIINKIRTEVTFAKPDNPEKLGYFNLRGASVDTEKKTTSYEWYFSKVSEEENKYCSTSIKFTVSEAADHREIKVLEHSVKEFCQKNIED